ncbi:glycosyltransferase [Ottowia thiooxydans]|uniref:GT2 family glycosyltransferase n=1 Tax=Ottowia thiooxydans TaxID=219182 RepID=A0ABV2Q9P0_9BURK
MTDVIVASATRLPAERFWQEAALGQSLRRLAFDTSLRSTVAFENTLGLPVIYNRLIGAAPAGSLLVFLHDDVWIDDYFFSQRIADGLQKFDAIGVAGNRRRVRNQPAWAFVNERLEWDDRANLSGSVAHGKAPFGAISHFGPSPAECELLDGVLLAARRDALVNDGVRFDERFNFHFYDMDFCRSLRAKGLRLGTWPIALTHQSGGAFGTPGWQAGRNAYLRKWEALVAS